MKFLSQWNIDLRKAMCVLLSCIFTLNSGCYSLQTTTTIKKENAISYFEMDSIIKGQLIRVHFEEPRGGSIQHRIGRIIQVTATELIIKQYRGGAGAVETASLVIPFNRIVMIDLLDRHLNVVRTYIGVSIAAVALSYIILLIGFAQAGKKFENEKTPLAPPLETKRANGRQR